MADASIVAAMTQGTVAQLYLGSLAYAAQATGEEKLAAQAISEWCADVLEGIPPIDNITLPDDERAYLASLLEGMRFEHPKLDEARVHIINVLRGSPSPPEAEGPVFTITPRPFGVAQTVAGIEWQTDINTSGEVRYTRADQPDGPWAIVVDDSRQRNHQRTLSPLSAGTAYIAKVAAKARNRPTSVATVEFQTVGDVVLPDGGGGVAGVQSAIGIANVATMDAEEAEAVLVTGLRMVQAEGIPFWAEKNGQGVAAWSLPNLVAIAKVVQRYSDAVFLLTVVNWNGASQRAQNTSWFDARLADIKREVLPLLGNRLWLEGVSEPDETNAKCSEWIRRAAASGIGTLVGNGPGGRGTPLAGGIVDWHYCDFNELLNNLHQNRIHSTDCTPTLVSNLNETQVRQATRKAIELQARLILYDTDNAPALNRNALAWMADEVNKATPPPGGTISSPNLLESSYRPWTPNSLTQLDPGWESALLAYCRANVQTKLVLSDMDRIPDRMREAGFRGRDNALWYTLSRSYAEWPWQPEPGDPDNHLSGQRNQLHDFWLNYLQAILNVMKAVPAVTALFLLNDGHDKCGDVLSDYSLRHLSPVASRIERGSVHH